MNSLFARFKSALLALGIILVAMHVARSANLTVISNTPNNVLGGSLLLDTDFKAMMFSTGSYSSYISSIILGLNPTSALNPPASYNVRFSLWSATQNGAFYQPDTQLGITGLQSVSIAGTGSLYTFDGIFSGGGFSMAANTPYALVVSSDADGIKWGRNLNSTPVGSAGFTFLNFMTSDDSGTTWGNTNMTSDNAIVMQVGVVPEPSTAMMSLVLLAGVATLLVIRSRKASKPLPGDSHPPA